MTEPSPSPATTTPRTARLVRAAAAPLGAGLLLAAALPPFGWWPLGLAGMAWWYHLLGSATGPRGRFLIGWLVGVASFAVGISWFSEFSAPGFVLATLGEAAFWGLGSALVLAGNRRGPTFVAGLIVAELARARVPFGGIPLAGIDLGQAAGPLAPAARLGGRVLVAAVAALVGVAVVEALSRRRMPALVAGALAAVLVALGAASSGGVSTRSIEIAAVQGGGPRGFRASEASAVAVWQRHLQATEQVRPPVDLLMWPEDVVDVTAEVTTVEAGEVLAGLARRYHATFVAGVVEDAPDMRFHNAAVVWGPDGEVLGRYEKLHRVPFGEYFPFRSFVERFYEIPSRDALVGRGSNVIDTPAGRLGFAISYEGFFSDRGRAAVNDGAELYLIPTNAASFRGSIVPNQQLAAARLRAWETGRWVLQAGPTGLTAVIDDRGRIQERSTLSATQVIQTTVPLRQGTTPYARLGDAGVATAAAAVWAAIGVELAVRRRRAHTPAT